MNTTKPSRKRNAFPFRLTLVCAAVLSCTLPFEAAADTPDTAAQEAVQLEKVVVKGKRKIHRKETEITGLGKVVKHSDGLSKELVSGIRDLTRYDPSIAVVEQGRGASSGYSIRGMDRNRVGLNVDGLPQVQSYTIDDTSASSGAINEIEYENITTIEINKGANSAEQGNGALGGSLAFRTKEPGDIIKEGQNWGLDTKTAYSGKDSRFTQSVAAAGRLKGFEGLAVFTHRKGQEIKVHRDAGSGSQTIRRLAGYTYDRDINDPESKSWFVLEGDCADVADCGKVRQLGHMTATEERVKQETVSSDAYTGPNRILPNPMDYQSRSWLAKLGYRFTPRHYLGGVYENTRQQYDIRDMAYAQYWTFPPEPLIKEGIGKGVYRYGSSIDSGSVVFRGSSTAPSYIGMGYSRLRYFDERHDKTRKGLVYRYENPDKNTWADRLSLSFDQQEITLDTRRHELNCSVYPDVDKNCRPAIDKPWSYYHSERTIYGEERSPWNLEAEKKFTLGPTAHKVVFGMGLDRFKSLVKRQDVYAENAQHTVESLTDVSSGTPKNPEVFRFSDPKLLRYNLCHYGSTAGVYNCNPRQIDGRSRYIALRDHMNLGKYFDWGLGGRYDYHKMTTADSWTASGTFRNWSWNSGLVFKPTANLGFSHRISNGFRVPSFQELFGYRVPGYEQGKDDDVHYVGKFKPEKALNNEFGVHLKGGFGYMEASYFRNRYKDLIGLTHISQTVPGLTNSERARGYRNMYNAVTDGINLIGKIDWNGVSDKLPEGLYSTVAYNRVKLKQAKLTNDYFQHSCSLLLDAIQPARYVLGLGYDAPGGRWGINGTMTYSKAKNPDELKGQCKSGFITHNEAATQKTTKPWYIFDVSGYLTLKDKLTLRGGIYNLANRKYSQWESVRQSALGSVNRQTDVGDYTRYAAPGRNFAVSLEMKF